jgi:hypothetical protein
VEGGRIRRHAAQPIDTRPDDVKENGKTYLGKGGEGAKGTTAIGAVAGPGMTTPNHLLPESKFLGKIPVRDD